jgi:hypothetical protein
VGAIVSFRNSVGRLCEVNSHECVLESGVLCQVGRLINSDIPYYFEFKMHVRCIIYYSSKVSKTIVCLEEQAVWLKGC